jgi:Uma2 family endonuclease
MVMLQFSDIELPSLIVLKNISWEQFNDVVEELKNQRITYFQGKLAILTPLPEHELTKGHISDVVKFILKRQNRNYLSFGSTTFKNREKSVGVEPDECFYINSEAKFRAAKTLDTVPDLAIEIDITSKTNLEVYRILQFPEVWIWSNNKIQIHILEQDSYLTVDRSLIFPDLDINDIVSTYINACTNLGVIAAEAVLDRVLNN